MSIDFVSPAHWVVIVLCLSLYFWMFFTDNKEQKSALPPALPVVDSNPIVFLFSRGTLIDANAKARDILGRSAVSQPTWIDIRRIFESRIPSLPHLLGSLHQQLSFYPHDALETEPRAVVDNWGDTTRITLYNWRAILKEDPVVTIRNSELEALNQASRLAPFPIWRVGQKGDVLWANDEYLRLCSIRTMSGYELKRSPIVAAPHLSNGDSFRTTLTEQRTGELQHLDVHVCEHGTTKTLFGLDASKLSKAESARRDLIQTLTKTFAQLSTGLAVFDKDRQLVLYNPALVDLLNLKGQFLSSRPTFVSFFDLLRRHQMVPEPSANTSWREFVTSIDLSASSDRYDARWQIDSGRTYLVKGRPHPNGAIGFLFEDITAKVTLERGFRAQIDLQQAVLDQMTSGIAVLNAAGEFLVTNQPFRDFWDLCPEANSTRYRWSDFEIPWREKVKEGRVFAKVREFLHADATQHPWRHCLGMADHSELHVTGQRISSGYTLLTFQVSTEMKRLQLDKKIFVP